MSDGAKYHHGRTPAAWTASVIATIGSIVAAIGFLMNISWTVVWIGLGLMAASVIVGGVMVKLGYGQQYADH
ncbi:MAG: HGxxPAAW family protein [Propioniciclava sp.]|uniref:HGxxPAAW family protein n=1 Tax=Propioniciclava sp. TaxID=2038686 RepID=UPI0039E4238B